MMYSNLCLSFRETVPLMYNFGIHKVSTRRLGVCQFGMFFHILLIAVDLVKILLCNIHQHNM